MRVVLIGNYGPDRQESMIRYATLLHDGLGAAGIAVRLAVPEPVIGPRLSGGSMAKWAGYLDKYVLGTRTITRLARDADIVHICDHSNAVYVPVVAGRAHVVTCHDLLAVRGALGEDTDCPATPTGRILQRRILAGLRRAQAVACVSRATLNDARRLLGQYRGRLEVVPNALNHPFRKLDESSLQQRLAAIPALQDAVPYFLHVGSNLRRKNRAVLLQALALLKTRWPGRLVVAGAALSPELAALASGLGVRDRIVEVPGPDNDLLEALYNGAIALAFPSRYEGFGWPVIEAQACGCAVVCSNREPLPEVAGEGAIFCDADDAPAFANAIHDLWADPARRDRLTMLGSSNIAAYDSRAMVDRFIALYRSVLERQ